jgi:hypothetical protein
MVNRQGDNAVSLFAAHLKTYIDEQEESDQDPYQSPKICPFDGTVPQDSLLDELKLEGSTEGLLAISNDNDSSDEAEIQETPRHISIYWKPQQGKISIVTIELANSLAQITGCSFFPDHGANRVGISGVNFKQALYKLQNLEKLQVRPPLGPRSSVFLTWLDTSCFSAIGRVIEGNRKYFDTRKTRKEHCNPVPTPNQRRETLRTDNR